MLPSSKSFHTAPFRRCLITRLLALTLFGVAATNAWAGAQPPPDYPRVSTLAGSGALGTLDGAANSASFIFPMAVAYGPDGTLYVADAGAQRIRAVGRNGAVSTVAGGGKAEPLTGLVPGGYKDGSALKARFNFPDGLAVSSSGDIYVSDKNNHCIRLISHGIVSTFAGTALQAGAANGPRTSATFGRPRGLTLDHDGNLYIADSDTGIRVIDRSGNVRNLQIDVTIAFDVAVLDAPLYRSVVVADALGIIARLAPAGREVRWGFSDNVFKGTSIPQGSKALGFPFGIVALDDSRLVAYTDARTNTVRTLDVLDSDELVLGGEPMEDASNYGGGFLDDVGQRARFLGPAGIARDSDGTLSIADAGNRRIRKIGRYDRRTAFRPNEGGDLFPTAAFKKSDYRIFLVGNSAIWYNNRWSNSVNEKLQEDLIARHPRARVQPIVINAGTLDSMSQYVYTLAQNGLADAIVIIVNSGTLQSSYHVARADAVRNSALWQSPFTHSLSEVGSAFSRYKIPVLVVLVPAPSELSINENIWNQVLENSDNVPYAPIERQLADATRLANVPFLNLWPVFRNYANSSFRSPLYGSYDEHLAAQGRALLASSIAKELDKSIP